jgi:hypothetical protein
MPKKPAKKKQRAGKNRTLRCRVQGDVLTIEVGINTLAFAALHSPFVYELVGGATVDTGEPAERFRIDDKLDFAHDVASELNREAEDGSSMITDLLDKACQKAIEEGSIAFIDTREEE